MYLGIWQRWMYSRVWLLETLNCQHILLSAFLSASFSFSQALHLLPSPCNNPSESNGYFRYETFSTEASAICSFAGAPPTSAKTISTSSLQQFCSEISGNLRNITFAWSRRERNLVEANRESCKHVKAWIRKASKATGRRESYRLHYPNHPNTYQPPVIPVNRSGSMRTYRAFIFYILFVRETHYRMLLHLPLPKLPFEESLERLICTYHLVKSPRTKNNPRIDKPNGIAQVAFDCAKELTCQKPLGV